MFDFLQFWRKKKEPIDTNTSAYENAVNNVAKERRLRRSRNEARTRYRLLRWLVWMDFAGSTTLHGPIHVSSTYGLTRLYYSTVVFIMATMFFFHSGHLVKQYLGYPILTAIKYDNVDFHYPDITLCPNSPFSDIQLYKDNRTAEIITNAYEMASDLWFRSADFLNMSPDARIKRSLTRQFYENALHLGKSVVDQVIFCELNGIDCLGNFIITEHPVYFRCFTLRLNYTPPVPSGATHGVQLVLHRGPKGARPLLAVDENEPFIIQSNADPIAKADFAPDPERNSSRIEKDGFYVAFHERGTYPNYPLQNLPNGLALRYGYFTRISLASQEQNSVNLQRRPCIHTEGLTLIQLARHDVMSESNFKSDRSMEKETLSEFDYTQQSCLANFRQMLTMEQCGCFTEAYMIPYSWRHVGLNLCHDVEQTTSNIIKMPETLACIASIENMTDSEIVAAVSPTIPGDGIRGCPLRCDYRNFGIHMHYSSKLKQDFAPVRFITYFERVDLLGWNSSFKPHICLTDPPIKAEDLIFLDISPVAEGINQIIEDYSYSFLQFISELGGVSGLYVGITMYTVAEFVDFVTRFLLLLLPYIWYHICYRKKKADNRRLRDLVMQLKKEPYAEPI